MNNKRRLGKTTSFKVITIFFFLSILLSACGQTDQVTSNNLTDGEDTIEQETTETEDSEPQDSNENPGSSKVEKIYDAQPYPVLVKVNLQDEILFLGTQY